MKKIIALLFSLSTLFFVSLGHAKSSDRMEVKSEKDNPAFDIAFAPCSPATAAPTVDVQNPVCSAGSEVDGRAFITDYDPSMVYLFTPSGPNVASDGEILDFVSGENYTVVADNGTCTSEAASFVIYSWDDFDCDGDGVPNGVEVVDETGPYAPCDYDDHHQGTPTQAWLDMDCDGDGVSNEQELLDGTNPLDTCSFSLEFQQTPSQNWLDMDCDGDGVTNGDELVDSTDPLLSCDLEVASQTVSPNSGWLGGDCDGDGVTNGNEVNDGTNPIDGCDYLEGSKTLPPSFSWNQGDCDGDGVTNENELIDGTDPLDACDYNSSNQVTPSQAWLDADCDSDGINNGDELSNGSDPLDPCDPNQPSIPTATIVQPDCSTPTGEVNVTTPLVGVQYTLTGMPPLVFSQTNPSGEFTNLNPGDYELTVLDNNCNSVPLSIEIEQGVPNSPTFAIVPATCTTAETASIADFNPAYTYDFSPNDGIAVDGSGNITNATIGVTYSVEVTNGIGCTSGISTLELDDMLPTPNVPDLQITSAVCGIDGSVEVLNYDPSYTYLFSPSSGVFVNNTTYKIMGATFGTSYTVKVVNSDGCESQTTSFVVEERLLIPSYSFTAIQPTQCGEEGEVTFTFTNVADGTYTMTYVGGSFEINISGGTGVVSLPDGMYSDVTINNGDCSSTVGSTIQIINPITPPTPSVITHGVNCSNGGDGHTLITNYDASLTYSFAPSGPTISATGEIENAVFGVTYTLTTVESGCHSSGVTFTNIAWIDGDCDGDGVTNGDEITDGTDPQNICDFVVEHQTLPPSQQWLDLDCDRDGVINGDELTDGTDPANPCDLIVGSQTVPPSNEWINGDCDGDGVTNGTEVIDGTNLLDACDFVLAHINNPSQAWLDSDCDGDGVTNGDELAAGTDLFDLCDYEQDKVTLSPSQAWLDSDCDGDGVTNGDESKDETDLFDPCDLVVEHQTVPPSQDWLEGDCDGDGVTNGDELALGGDIFDACSPNVCTLFVPEIFTPDGDGINDYWRIDGIENYPNNTLVIMNRWGNVVYETEGYNNEWNGFSTSGLNVGGDELPTGTYYYVLDSKNSEIGVLKGYIYLQR